MSRSHAETAKAMDSFLASVERRAYRMAVIATRNEDEAMDVVQDAMLKLVKSYSDKPSEEWGPLFHRILQSTLMDWHRRGKVRSRWRVWLGGKSEEEEDEDPLYNLAVDPQPTPEASAHQDDAMAALNSALAKLPMRQQQVFLLRQWEGLDVAQTAQALGVSEGSIKTHYSRAVESLREMLEEHW